MESSGKWRFVRLAPTGMLGLAGIAGGWEGSEELVDSRSDARRRPGRAALRYFERVPGLKINTALAASRPTRT
jgi:hypothetical protein